MGPFLSRRIPALNHTELEKGVREANRTLLSCGITSIQDATRANDHARWSTLKTWKDRRLFEPRVRMLMGIEAFGASAPKRPGRPGVKIILDETTGHLYPPQVELNQMLENIHKSGAQAAIHAIEANAIEAAVAAIAQACRKSSRRDHRHRIEHCSVCPPSLSRRLATLGVVVVTQPAFLYYHGDRYLKTVAERQRPHLYPLGTLLANGVRIAAGSDCPIVGPNPLIGMYAAVCRRSEAENILSARERLNPLDALRMFTQWAAYAGFEESRKGSLAPGKLADLAVLDADPTRLPAAAVKDIKVEMTILDGNIVFDKRN